MLLERESYAYKNQSVVKACLRGAYLGTAHGGLAYPPHARTNPKHTRRKGLGLARGCRVSGRSGRAWQAWDIAER